MVKRVQKTLNETSGLPEELITPLREDSGRRQFWAWKLNEFAAEKKIWVIAPMSKLREIYLTVGDTQDTTAEGESKMLKEGSGLVFHGDNELILVNYEIIESGDDTKHKIHALRFLRGNDKCLLRCEEGVLKGPKGMSLDNLKQALRRLMTDEISEKESIINCLLKGAEEVAIPVNKGECFVGLLFLSAAASLSAAAFTKGDFGSNLPDFLLESPELTIVFSVILMIIGGVLVRHSVPKRSSGDFGMIEEGNVNNDLVVAQQEEAQEQGACAI